MVKHILILPGDGIGPEVIAEAVKVLHWFHDNTSHRFYLHYGKIGGEAIAAYGVPLTEETLALARQTGNILLGAVGGPQWDGPENTVRPEQGLLQLRQKLELFANLRPIQVLPELVAASPLKKEYLSDVNFMIVRELTGDVYFGTPRGILSEHGEQVGFNTMRYSAAEIERIAHFTFRLAQTRRNTVCSVDKANVLETSLLWRKIVQQVRDRDYPRVQLTHMYVDNAAMQIIRNPGIFDVLLTGNLFGDILSDEAAMLTGSLGMLPSASLGEKVALYEPIHGSAPDIAGKNRANPLGAILSVAMLFEHSFQLHAEAQVIFQAVQHLLAGGMRTQDMVTEGCRLVSTTEMGNSVIEQLNHLLHITV